MKRIFSFIPALLLFACTNNAPEGEEAGFVNHQAQGDSITTAAQQVLLKNVASAMKQGGPVHAIEFCNLNASPLIDSLSGQHGATISRISEKNRNPNNKASGFEIELLTALESQQQKDTVVLNDDKITYYKTIRLGMPACIKCHGIPNDDINEATLEVLNRLYPNDLATGYKLEEFRGAWKVEFESE